MPNFLTQRLALPCLVFLYSAALLFPATLAADEEGDKDTAPESRVAVTVILPAELDDFHGSALVVTLYEFDPRLADAGATPREQVIVRHLGHQQGIEQTLRFNIGDTLNAPNPDRKYYLSVRIYEDLGDEDGYAEGEQLHYCHNEHPNLPGTVYDTTNGSEATFTAR
ncbi:hypothetical protein OT109_03295 [Phycisphaeraceae bacterium D3-23]